MKNLNMCAGISIGPISSVTSPISIHIHDLTDKNVYMGKTSLSNDVHCCICTLAMGKTSPLQWCLIPDIIVTNASAPILLTAARADLVTTF